MATIVQTSDIRPGQVFSNPDITSWVYNGLDSAVTAEVYETIIQDLDNTTRQTYELEKAMQGPILDMNMVGVLIDKVELNAFRLEMEQTTLRIEENLNAILKEGYGVEIKWSSPKQVQWFLYEFLRLPIQRKRNAKGTYSPTADRDTLEKLSFHLSAIPFISHVLALRDIQKRVGFLNTEIDLDGCIRCNFNIAGTVSGRLASSYSDFGTGTNLQNVDRAIRKLFIARKGKKFLNVDLEQADSRNIGAFCWNRFLTSHGPEFAGAYLDACESGDLHTTVTSLAWTDLPWTGDRVQDKRIAQEIAYRDHTYRDLGKVLGHGTNYVGKPFTMAMHSKIPVKWAEDFQVKYFSAFPCIREDHKAVRKELMDFANLTTLLGRRRYFFNRLDQDKTIRDAVSYEGQGSTADEINEGTLQVWRRGKRFPGFQLLLQVHDSLLIEFDEECENEIIPWVLETMPTKTVLAGGRPFHVPVEAKTGWNWGDYNDRTKDSKGKALRLNLDGVKKWSGHDTRTRQQEPRLSIFD